MLCLPRNLRFEVDKVLCLPRNLHFKIPRGSQSAVPATKSAFQDTSRFTKCCACHEICTSRFTKCCACYEICTSRFTKCYGMPATKLHFEVHKALYLPRSLHLRGSQMLHLPRNLHIEGDRVLCLPRKLQASHMSESHDLLHLSRNQSSSKITTMSKVLCLPRNLHFEVKPLRSLAPVGKSRLWTTLAPATKSDHVRKCAWHHNKSAVATRTRRGHPDFASLRSRSARRLF